MMGLKKHKDILQDKISYRFKNEAFLEKALKHSSFCKISERHDSNQIFEFLGDRVLGLAIADYLFKTFPHENEGILSKHLNHLVSKPVCATIAISIDLGSALYMSNSETSNGGRKNENILGDAMEALIAAIYLDSDYLTAKSLILSLWEKIISEPYETIDNKSALQEWAQARSFSIPTYELIDKKGPDHAPFFTIQAKVETNISTGTGHSKRIAEQEAAKNLLSLLKEKKKDG